MFGRSGSREVPKIETEYDKLKKKVLQSLDLEMQVLGLRGTHGAETWELIKRIGLIAEEVNYYNALTIKDEANWNEAAEKVLSQVSLFDEKNKKPLGIMKLIMNPESGRPGSIMLDIPDAFYDRFGDQMLETGKERQQSRQLVITAMINVRYVRNLKDFDFWLGELRNRIIDNNALVSIAEEHPYKFAVDTQTFYLDKDQITGLDHKIALTLSRDQTGKFAVKVDTQVFDPQNYDRNLEDKIMQKLAGVTMLE